MEMGVSGSEVVAVRQWLEDLPEPVSERIDALNRARLSQVLATIRHRSDARLLVRHLSSREWEITVLARDGMGLLSIIAGLFTAHQLDIAQGDVFTLGCPKEWGDVEAIDVRSGPRRSIPRASTAPSRLALDVFQVRSGNVLDEHFWASFEDELKHFVRLLGEGNDVARERLIEKITRGMGTRVDAESRLLPVLVEVDNENSEHWTRLAIQSTDTPGFMFEFTAALAILNVNIDRVEIRTIDGKVHDTFWVTDAAGRKITEPGRIHEVRVAAALIKQFMHLLPRAPNPAQALRQFAALAREVLTHVDWVGDLRSLQSHGVLQTLAQLLGMSQFLWEDFLRMQHENLFAVVQDVPALEEGKSSEQLRRELQEELAGSDSAERVERLNQFKDREMFRTDLRHITGRIGFVQLSAELSDLAETVVQHAAHLCHDALRPTYGVPMTSAGTPCSWCIFGLGKFGGREMGFASDIELIFVYQAGGETTGPSVMDNSQYFQYFVRKFLRTLHARREGIFEIDLRLRPHGNAGNLACSADGFADFYSERGGAEQFHRLALVKLRCVAGDSELATRLVRVKDAFVYRAMPLDYENIHHLRHRQRTELVPAGTVHVKYGAGGLVDVEYLVQTRQIEVGRVERAVRTTNTLDAIDQLVAHGHMEPKFAAGLRDTYGFLRRLIDALRVVRGHAKDLTVPHHDTQEFAYLARRLQYGTAQQLAHDIAAHMDFAAALWRNGRSHAPHSS
jgi:glutamate-ammonia-ligase adenylyltransferase